MQEDGAMIVCICKGVSDREIQGAIHQGARTLAAIGNSCGAGTCCGACRGDLQDMLAGGGVGRGGQSLLAEKRKSAVSP
jgi:bacterioferritin-associated ferredoxin